MSGEAEAIEEVLGGAVTAALQEHGGDFVIRWIALVEVLDADGDTAVWTFTSPKLRSWESTGLLTHALHSEQAQTVAEWLADDTDPHG